MEEGKVHVTVRLGATAVIMFLLIIALGWLRYDLGKETFYNGVTFASGGISVLLIIVVAFFLFRLVQRSDNKEIAQSGETKAMYQLLATVEASKTKEMVAVMRMLMESQGKQLPALPGWDDDEDDEPLVQPASQPISANPFSDSTAEPHFAPVDAYGWVSPQRNGNGYHNGNGYSNGNGTH